MDNTTVIAKIINAQAKLFSKVYRHGFMESESSMNFDASMQLLESFYILNEPAVVEPVIKFQCSCESFWKRYKCPHSLALSVLRKGVPIPPSFRLDKIGNAAKRGRPRLSHGGHLPYCFLLLLVLPGCDSSPTHPSITPS